MNHLRNAIEHAKQTDSFDANNAHAAIARRKAKLESDQLSAAIALNSRTADYFQSRCHVIARQLGPRQQIREAIGQVSWAERATRLALIHLQDLTKRVKGPRYCLTPAQRAEFDANLYWAKENAARIRRLLESARAVFDKQLDKQFG